MIRTVVCDICTSPIATVDMDEISVPMAPGMFKSLDESRCIPSPFREFQDFNTFRCRRCQGRPFMHPNQITIINDKGFRQQINIDKLDIERKTREANQAKIDELFRDDEPTVPGRVRGFVSSVLGKKDEQVFRCECGAEYKHQSSLARHKKVCNAR